MGVCLTPGPHSLDDMRILYGGFDFDKISTSMTINGPATQILAMYFNAAAEWAIDKFKAAKVEIRIWLWRFYFKMLSLYLAFGTWFTASKKYGSWGGVVMDCFVSFGLLRLLWVVPL